MCIISMCSAHILYHMHKYAQNMPVHKYAKPNMHKYAFSKYT